MAVAIDATGTSALFNNTTTINYTGITVGTGSNRALVVFICFNHDFPAPTGITVTWDSGGTNQAMTAITGASGGTAGLPGANVACYGLVAPTSGNKTLAVSWTNACWGYVEAQSYTGVDQTGGATSFAHGNSATANSAAPALTITSATGNIAAVAMSDDAQNITAVNQTQMFINTSGGQGNAAGNYANGAASVSFTATIAGACPWAYAGCDVVAFVAAGDTLGGAMQMMVM